MTPAPPPASTLRWQDATAFPRIDLEPLDAGEREAALRFLRSVDCTCGCASMKIAECAYLDPQCPAIPPLGEALVRGLKEGLLGEDLRYAVLSTFPPRYLARLGPPRLDPPVVMPTHGSTWKGASRPAVTVVAFIDFQSSACRDMVPFERALLRAFPDEVRLVLKLVPPPWQEDGLLAAEAALAADAQGAFWPMHRRLFEECASFEVAKLQWMAEQIGLDPEEFARDLREHAHRGQIERDLSLASASGVAETPAYFVNGRRYRGTLFFEPFHDLVAEEVERSRRGNAPFAPAGPPSSPARRRDQRRRAVPARRDRKAHVAGRSPSRRHDR